MPDPQQPFLTLRFFPSGDCESIRGPAQFPVEPNSIKLVLGTVHLVLWQLNRMGYERMLALSEAQENIRAMLANMPVSGDPS